MQHQQHRRIAVIGSHLRETTSNEHKDYHYQQIHSEPASLKKSIHTKFSYRLDHLIVYSYENGLHNIALDRPKALNSLSLSMINNISSLLQKWWSDDSVKVVVISTSTECMPLSFCAGGDLKEFSTSGKWEFAHNEYRLDWRIHHFPKPFISIIDGISMGGGVGVSVHARYRVVTERIVWAMPEIQVGYFTDVGTTFFLAYCPGFVGMYLALTATRIKLADVLYCGIGTHFIPSEKISILNQKLTTKSFENKTVEQILARFSLPFSSGGQSTLSTYRNIIDHCFSAPSVEEIIERLNSLEKKYSKENVDTTNWINSTLNALRSACPTSLKVVHRAISQVKQRNFSIEEALRTELRIGTRMVDRYDISEGIRSVLKDKDSKPRWNPAKLSDVGENILDEIFAPFRDPEKELRFEDGSLLCNKIS